MKKITLLTMLLISTCSFSQTSKRQAFKLFKGARNNYFEKNYKKASELFNQSITKLGKTTVPLQSFYILSLHEIEDWQNLETEIPKFFILPSNSTSEHYSKILEIQEKLKIRLEEEKNYYDKVKALNTITDYKSFLYKYPKSKYSKEVKTVLTTLEEEELWQTSISRNTLSSMENYLENSILKKHTTQAEQKINNWDNEAKTKAIEINTQYSYKSYLIKFKNGKHRDIILNKLALKKEDDLFNNVKNSSSITNLESYLKSYPNGRYKNKINILIEQNLIASIKGLNQTKQYRKIQNETEEYQQKFPNGKNIKYVNRLNSKAYRNLKKKHSSLLLISYETNEAFGFQIGSLRKRNLGWYFTARGNEAAFDATFKREDEVTQEEFNLINENEKIETILGSASLGLTFPLYYPVYINAGVGVNYKQYVIGEIEDFNHRVFSIEEEKPYDVFPEAGLIIKIGPVIISGGASYIREEIIYKVGFGFAL